MLAANHSSYLSNKRIKSIIEGRDFFPDLEILAFVLNPIRETTVLALEAHSASPADTYPSWSPKVLGVPKGFGCAKRFWVCQKVSDVSKDFVCAKRVSGVPKGFRCVKRFRVCQKGFRCVKWFQHAERVSGMSKGFSIVNTISM